MAPSGARSATADHLGVTAIRWLLAAALVAALPLADAVPVEDRLAFGYGLAFLWVPATGVLRAVRARRPARPLRWLASGLDLAPFIAALWVLPQLQALTVGALLVVVGFWTLVGGTAHGAALASTVAFAVVGAALTAGGSVLADVATAVAVTVPVAAVVWLVGAAGRGRSVAQRHVTRLEAQTGAVLTGVAEAIVITSPAGRVRTWNQAAERTFARGADEATTLACHGALGLRHGLRELDCSSGCALLQLAQQEGSAELEVWRPLGRDRRQPLLAHVAPITDAEGRVVEVVHSFRDVTRLKEAEEAKTMFLASASHELKTPLTVIEGFAELLANDPDPTSVDVQFAIRAIHNRSGELRHLVERLLLSSRIDAGQLDLELAPMSIVPLVHDRTQHLASATGREVPVSVSHDLPEVRTERRALETVVEHLVENAIKYSPDGGPVEVTLHADATHVLLSVTDHGVGMTPDEVSRCFDRFWQADGTNSRRFGGSGIGLYVVRSLVEGLDGDISVDSQPGVGTRFTVRLPRADVAPSTGPSDGNGTDAHAPEPSIIREFMRQVGVGSLLGGS